MRLFLAICVFVPALLPPAAIAQGVTASATSVTVGGSIQVGTAAPIVRQVAAGTPLSGSSITLAFGNATGIAVATTNGTVQVGDTLAGMTLNQTVVARNQATASVQADVLLDVNLPVTVRARVELELSGTLNAGTPMPAVSADIGNDGVLDLSGAFNRTASTTRMLGGNTPILLRSASAAAGGPVQQVSMLRIVLRVVPDSASIAVQPVLTGCGTGIVLNADETFRPGIQLRTTVPPRSATFLVAGLSATFTPVLGLPGCFVVPTPDVVVGATAAPVAIPSSVAPLQFYVQSVALQSPSPSLFVPHVSNSALVRFL